MNCAWYSIRMVGRIAAIVAILCFVAVHVASEQNQTAPTQKRHPNAQGPPPTPTIANNNQGPGTDSNHAYDGPPHWYAPFERPDWWLVIAAILTLATIAYQAREMRRATEVMRSSTDVAQRQTAMLERSTAATEKSVRLQEVAMRQWVSIENWQGQIITRQGERSLEFRFDIVNRTNFPLKLEFVMTNAYGCGAQQRADHVLGPEKEFSVRRTTGRLSDIQHLSYCESKLMIDISGAVTYEDVFEIRRTQRFNATCYCSAHSGFFFYQYAGTQESDFGEVKKDTQPK